MCCVHGPSCRWLHVIDHEDGKVLCHRVVQVKQTKLAKQKLLVLGHVYQM